MNRRTVLQWLLTMTLVTTVTVAAHPGHEHHAEGSVTKVRGQIFEMEDAGGKVTFVLVASTEVFIGKIRGAPSDIKVGVLVEVDGIENERGAIEAKTVRLMAR
jgi:hypothetical protein